MDQVSALIPVCQDLSFNNDWIGGLFNSDSYLYFFVILCLTIRVTIPEDFHINYLELVPVYIGLMYLTENHDRKIQY